MAISAKFWWEWMRRLGLLFILLLAGGCAAERGVFNYGISPAIEANRPVWPAAASGEAPRFVYTGQLTGEENFFAKRKERSGFEAFLYWLAGLFNEEAPPVVLQRPQSGTVDGAGRIYVTDSSRQAVYVFDKEAGQLLVWEEASRESHFVSPAGIAVSDAGFVYVADADLGVVAVLSQKGEPLGEIGYGELRRPIGVAYDAATHHLFVADTYAHDIKVFGEDGRLLRTIGQRGDQPGEFNFPTYLVLAQGQLYVTDTMNTRVQVLDPETGEAKLTIGQQGLNIGDMVRPKGVAVDSEGNVYVVESYYDHLLVYNRRGEFLLPIGGTGKEIGNFFLPAGVWTDTENRVYVADMFNGRISIFQFLGGGAANE